MQQKMAVPKSKEHYNMAKAEKIWVRQTMDKNRTDTNFDTELRNKKWTRKKFQPITKDKEKTLWRKKKETIEDGKTLLKNKYWRKIRQDEYL